MTFRFLPRDEWSKILPVFKHFGCKPPHIGRIWVGEENGEIISLQCIHYVTHLGPVWVRPDKRKQGIWRKMQEALEERLPRPYGFYQFGTVRNASQLKRLGLTCLGWVVWVKRLI